MQTWEEAQAWEVSWHGNCVNSYQEESKQIAYAARMGLKAENFDGRYPVIDFRGAHVIDMGGGPYSLLLKGVNLTGTVVDPGLYPDWVMGRYQAAGLTYVRSKGEDFISDYKYDVGLLYNCLQHTEDPEKIVHNMRYMCNILYIHEWLDTPISDGHIQTITKADLDRWLNTDGMVGYERWSDTVVTPYYYGMYLS
jgi:hypothetical protein